MTAAAGIPGGFRLVKPSPIPGFGLSLGLTVFFLSVIVLIPLSALAICASGVGFEGFYRILADPRVASALFLTFGLSFAAGVIDTVFGVLIAWVLVRYRFPGRAIIDAAVDLPFALPTAVAGIALSALYAPNGWIGALLAPLGISIGYTPYGILVALVFVGLPFVVRTVQPLIMDFAPEIEEASTTLGATRAQTIRHILLPPLIPAILTGFALSFARCVGEYGSVIFIAGNKPYVSEIVPLLIVIKLEEFDYAGATAIATLMLALSFIMLLVINGLQSWSRKRFGHV